MLDSPWYSDGVLDGHAQLQSINVSQLPCHETARCIGPRYIMASSETEQAAKGERCIRR